MHIERLRQARGTLAISAPKKQKHMQQNLKKELLNLCTVTILTFTLERMSEIQYQNRILLKKMLQIDV
jgi:2-C-methyl-D-erythritol 4-phosphate cytidylyltransferase